MTEGRHAWTPPSTFHSHRVQGPIMSNQKWHLRNLSIDNLFYFGEENCTFAARSKVNKILHAKAVYCFSSCVLLKSFGVDSTHHSIPNKTFQNSASLWHLRPNPDWLVSPSKWGLLGRWPHTSLRLQLFRCEDLDRRICSPWIFKRSVLRMLKLIFAQNTWNIMEHWEMCEKIKSTINFLYIVSCCSTGNSQNHIPLWNAKEFVSNIIHQNRPLDVHASTGPVSTPCNGAGWWHVFYSVVSIGIELS